MYLCYIDESGTSNIPGNTSHFVLAGITIPIWHWKTCDQNITRIKKKYDLENEEIHVAWILRNYLEQSKIPAFDSMSYHERRKNVIQKRNSHLLNLQKQNKHKTYQQVKKNYKKTYAYIHLTRIERINFIHEIADCVSNWEFARLFAECIDKNSYNPSWDVDEESFQQIISRFENFLSNVTSDDNRKALGILIHDNNETVSKKHTLLMKEFYKKGTLWTKIEHIIETPLFVDSELTSMIQIADLCSYSLRRYLENNESDLFNKIYKRADRKSGKVVGIRHYTTSKCKCLICKNHG